MEKAETKLRKKRSVAIPQKRWLDDINCKVGGGQHRIANNKKTQRTEGEVYLGVNYEGLLKEKEDKSYHYVMRLIRLPRISETLLKNFASLLNICVSMFLITTQIQLKWRAPHCKTMFFGQGKHFTNCLAMNVQDRLITISLSILDKKHIYALLITLFYCRFQGQQHQL